VSCAKTSELIKMPFGSWTRVVQKKHWCHLANTVEPSVCCDDAALSQITLITCYFVIIIIKWVVVVLLLLLLLKIY